ncbi:hypothetical protein RA269_29475, partial [Pseudomonas syringae pv. tagetis]
FTLSAIGLSLQRYSTGVVALYQRLEGGKALSDVIVDVYDDSGKVVELGKSVSECHAELPLPGKASVVLAL